MYFVSQFTAATGIITLESVIIISNEILRIHAESRKG